MTKNEMLVLVAAIVTTLAETNGCPESQIYMVCKMDMTRYEAIRDILVRANMVTIKGNYVKLTQYGKETADKLNKVIA